VCVYVCVYITSPLRTSNDQSQMCRPFVCVFVLIYVCVFVRVHLRVHVRVCTFVVRACACFYGGCISTYICIRCVLSAYRQASIPGVPPVSVSVSVPVSKCLNVCVSVCLVSLSVSVSLCLFLSCVFMMCVLCLFVVHACEHGVCMCTSVCECCVWGREGGGGGGLCH